MSRQAGDQHWTRRTPDRVLRGTRAPGAKLSARAIRQICEAFDAGASQTWIAEKHHVSRITVWRQLKAHGRL